MPDLRVSRFKIGVIFLSSLVFAAFPIIPGKNFFLSHVLLLLFSGTIILGLLGKKQTVLLLLLTATFLSAVFASAYALGPADRLVSDLSKIVIYLFAIYALSQTYTTKQLHTILEAMALTYAVFVVLRFLITEDAFSFSGRLSLDRLGGPNTFSSAAGVLILILLSEQRRLNLLLSSVLGGIFMVFLFLAFSRGVIGSLLLVFLLSTFGKDSKLRSLAVLLVGAVIWFVADDIPMFKAVLNAIEGKLDVLADIEQRGGSGRLGLWMIAIERLLERPASWLFGFGPATVLHTRVVGGEIRELIHPHNTYIFVLYSFGLVGSFLFWQAIRIAYKRSRFDYEYRSIRMRIILYYLLIFIVDVHLMASQVILIHATALALVFARPGPRQTAEQRQTRPAPQPSREFAK